MNRLILATLACCSMAAAADQPKIVEVDEPSITGRDALQLLSEDFALPITGSIGEKPFNLKIAEPTLPRVVARLCEEAPAACEQGIAGTKIYLQPAKRPPLARVDLADGSIYLISEISETRETFSPGESPHHTIELDGTLLTDPSRDIFGVASIEVRRVKGDNGDWRDVEPERNNVNSLGNQVQWGLHTWLRSRPDDRRAVTAIEGVIRISITQERATLTVDDPADAEKTDANTAAISCARGKPSTAAHEAAVLTFTGTAINSVRKKLNHQRGWRFVTVLDDAGQPADVDLDAEFQAAGLVVRIKQDKPQHLKSVVISIPIKIKNDLVPIRIDPLPFSN